MEKGTGVKKRIQVRIRVQIHTRLTCSLPPRSTSQSQLSSCHHQGFLDIQVPFVVTSLNSSNGGITITTIIIICCAGGGGLIVILILAVVIMRMKRQAAILPPDPRMVAASGGKKKPQVRGGDLVQPPFNHRPTAINLSLNRRGGPSG